MTAIEEVYWKYKYLDKPLSDKNLLNVNLVSSILYDLWKAIKDDQLVSVETLEPDEEIRDEW